MELVSSVQKDQIVAIGIVNALVHGIVQTIIRFTDKLDVVRIVTHRVILGILLYQGQGTIVTQSVYYQMLYVRISLRGDTLQRALQSLLGIIGNGNYGKLGLERFVHIVALCLRARRGHRRSRVYFRHFLFLNIIVIILTTIINPNKASDP